jgi:hypothetical protein
MEAENPARFKKLREDLDRPIRGASFRAEVAERKTLERPAFEARVLKNSLEKSTRMPHEPAPEAMRL